MRRGLTNITLSLVRVSIAVKRQWCLVTTATLTKENISLRWQLTVSEMQPVITIACGMQADTVLEKLRVLHLDPQAAEATVTLGIA